MAKKETKSVVVKKRPISKKKVKPKPKEPKTKKPAKKEKKDVFEVPVGKIVTVLIILGLIAVLVVGGIKLFKPKESNDIAAVVNGEIITWSRIEAQYDKLSPEFQQIITQEILLNQTIDEELLVTEVAEKQIQVPQEELDSLVDRVKAQFTEDELDKTLERQGLTMQGFTDQLGQRLLVNVLLTEEIPELEVTEEEIEDFFNENKELLDTPEMVRASHILVNSSEEAEDILALLAEGEDFAELAAEHSLDGTAQTGGDLGFFPRELMVSEFDEVAFSLEIDEISDAVETTFGFHIIMVTDKRDAKDANLDELRATIKFNLFDTKLRANQDKFNDYIQNLRANADIELFEK